MQAMAAFACGVVFALGLGISGMTRPDRVIGFLDVAGDWDATLGLVMAGAVAIGLATFPVILRRRRPVLAPGFCLPERTAIDVPLVVGAAVFGIGWGLSGWCPGPAIVSIASPSKALLAFLASMAAGMIAGRRLDGPRPTSSMPTAQADLARHRLDGAALRSPCDAGTRAVPGRRTGRRALRASLPAILLAGAILVPLAGKAFTIDDPPFLRQAEKALDDPLHPATAVMVWSEVPRPLRLSQVMPVGPVMAWLLVPTILAGGSEIVAHLTQFALFALSLFTVASLAIRLGGDDRLARWSSLLLASTPAALCMAGTAMPDIPAMALGLVGIERLVAWRQEGRPAAGIATAVSLGLAPLARSHAGLLIGLAPLFLEAPWRSRRQWLPVVGAVVLAGLLVWLTRDPLGRTSDIVRSAGIFSSTSNIRSNLVAFGTHWILLLPLGPAWIIARGARFWRSPLPYGCALAASVVVATSPLRAWLWIAPIAGLGIAVVLDVVAAALHDRDGVTIALAAWLLVSLPITVYLHFPSKYLVVSAPGAAIVAATALRTLPRRAARTALAGITIAGAVFGLLLLRADASFAGLGRRAVEELVRPHVARGERVWFNVNWGFQWYAERAGARIVTTTPPRPREGDLLVSARETVTGIPLGAFPRRELVAVVTDSTPGGRIVSTTLGTGFYSNGWGFLPWAWGDGEIDRFELWRLR